MVSFGKMLFFLVLCFFFRVSMDVGEREARNHQYVIHVIVPTWRNILFEPKIRADKNQKSVFIIEKSCHEVSSFVFPRQTSSNKVTASPRTFVVLTKSYLWKNVFFPTETFFFVVFVLKTKQFLTVLFFYILAIYSSVGEQVCVTNVLNCLPNHQIIAKVPKNNLYTHQSESLGESFLSFCKIIFVDKNYIIIFIIFVSLKLKII